MKVWAHILAALERHESCALVSVTDTAGSAPRDAGARMIVTPQGFHGTIGGGTLEWRAMAAAQALLGRGAATKITSHILGPDMGQCCGGRVQLATEVFDQTSLETVRQLAAREAAGPFTLRGRIASLDGIEAFGDNARRLYLFGAGHVGRSLVLSLAPLPFAIHWIDPRPGAFPRAIPSNVTALAPDEPVSVLAQAPAGSLALVMTHSHALDLALTDAALRNESIAHVGLIGSATKRARFEKRLREAGVGAGRVAGLICPIGVSGIRSKEPAMIAAATAAQLLILDEQLKDQAARPDAEPLRRVGNGERL